MQHPHPLVSTDVLTTTDTLVETDNLTPSDPLSQQDTLTQPDVLLTNVNATASTTPSTDVYLEAHFLFTLSTPLENAAWNYLDLRINVTQTYTPPHTTPPQNSAQTMQQLYPHATPDGKHIKEISVRIHLKHPHALRRYKFQLFCTIEENQTAVQTLHDSGTFADWTSMEALVFISYPDKVRSLHPISRTLYRSVVINRILINQPNMFLGSFEFFDNDIHHDNPATKSPLSTTSAHNAAFSDGEQGVVVVLQEDRVHEARKARAGRPSHRTTGELLMTKAQVQKVLEIRQRWRGLTPRQRRNHVYEQDFYPLLTLNRDEAARILPVCTTWFKDVIRLQGVKTWPGRPLRRSGALLEDLKEQLWTEEAALKFEGNQRGMQNRRECVKRLKTEIERVIKEREGIVKNNVSEKYFENWKRQDGARFLNPVWEALPPPVPQDEQC